MYNNMFIIPWYIPSHRLSIFDEEFCVLADDTFMCRPLHVLNIFSTSIAATTSTSTTTTTTSHTTTTCTTISLLHTRQPPAEGPARGRQPLPNAGCFLFGRP